MPRKTWTILALMLMLSLLTAACGSGDTDHFSTQVSIFDNGGGSTGSAAADYAPEAGSDYLTSEQVQTAALDSAAANSATGSAAFTSGSSAVTERLIIRTARYAIETEDYAETMDRLDLKILTSGAYVETMESRGGTEDIPAWASLTIRVPIHNYGSFKEAVSGLGYVRNAFEDTDDVTSQFYDTESRLNVLRAQEERILELIPSAQSLDDLFYIESELTRIRTEIEQLTTVLNRLSDLVAYATVKLEIHEVFPEEEDSDEVVGFGQRMSAALDGSLRAIVLVAQGLLLFVLWCWPLLILAAIALLIYLRIRKRRKLAQQKKRQEAEKPLANHDALEGKEEEKSKQKDE